MSKEESQATPEENSGTSEATQENSNTQVQTAEAAAKDQQELKDAASFQLRQGGKLTEKHLVKMSDETCLSLATELLHEDKSSPAVLARNCDKKALRVLRNEYNDKLRGLSAAWVGHLHEQGFKMEKRSPVNHLKNGDENITIKLVKKGIRIMNKDDILASVAKMNPAQVAEIKAALKRLKIEGNNDDAVDVVTSEPEPAQLPERTIA
jgi:hypothetical protein